MTGGPAEVAAALSAAAEALEQELTRAEEENLADVYRVAKLFSSGPHRLPDLRAMGHPYARRRRRPGRMARALNPAVINVQRGIFRLGWKQEGPAKGGGRLFSSVVNESDVAQFLAEGTPFMVPRPLPEAVKERLQSQVDRRRAEAVARALHRTLG